MNFKQNKLSLFFKNNHELINNTIDEALNIISEIIIKFKFNIKFSSLLLCYDDGVDEEKFQAIRASMNLIPTDGNGVSNSDCEQFGLDNYEQVDDVLKTMYYRKDSDIKYYDKEYIRLIDSYNEQGVDKVMVFHQNTEYKRKELPIKPTREELGL